jgi:hypothetical protein
MKKCLPIWRKLSCLFYFKPCNRGKSGTLFESDPCVLGVVIENGFFSTGKSRRVLVEINRLWRLVKVTK